MSAITSESSAVSRTTETGETTLAANGAQSDGDNKNNNSNSNVLLLMIIIFSFIFCTIIVLVLTFIFSFNKKKDLEIKQKQIELDMMVHREKEMAANGTTTGKGTNMFNTNSMPHTVPIRKLHSSSPSHSLMNLKSADFGTIANVNPNHRDSYVIVTNSSPIPNGQEANIDIGIGAGLNVDPVKGGSIHHRGELDITGVNSGVGLGVAAAPAAPRGGGVDEHDQDVDIDDLFDNKYSVNVNAMETPGGPGSIAIENGNINDGDDALTEESSDVGDGIDKATLTGGDRGGRAGRARVASGRAINISESNYEQWSQKEVMIWIKENLSNNGIEDAQIKSFLKEWSKKYITGSMLTTLKNEPNALNSLIAKCDEKQAPFGIWLVMQTIIQNLGNQKKNDDEPQLYEE